MAPSSMPHIRSCLASRSEEHTSELQSPVHLLSFPTRRSSDLACSTWPSRIVTRSAPSPSTRARPATVSCLVRWLIVVPVGEGGSGGVERREHPADGALVHAAYPELLGQ